MTSKNHVIAKISLNVGTDYTWPELAVPRVSEAPSTAICFSGGGTRALAAAVGQLRALTELGVIPTTRYISAVSGGGWAALVYTYYQSGANDDTELLGPIVEPSSLTLEGLEADLPPSRLAHTATQNLMVRFFEHVVDGVDQMWIDAVGEVFLSPFGLYETGVAHAFTLDEATRQEILSREGQHPSLADLPWHTVRQDAKNPRPFLVINASLLGPHSLSPVKKENPISQQFTPLYVGSPFATSSTFQGVSGGEETLELGGGLIEPFAYGGPAPARVEAGLLPVPMPARPCTLAEATGTASSAYAGLVEQLRVAGILHDFAPRQWVWPMRAGESPVASECVFGDGAVLENYGLGAMLQRKVERVVVFVNSCTPLAEDYDPSVAPTASDIDDNLPPLFGYPMPMTGLAMQNNQMFEQSDYAPTVRALQASAKSGGVSIARRKYRVKPNEFWGIEGNYEVEIMWVYLTRVPAWEAELHEDIRAEIVRGNSHGFFRGKLKYFPHYSTIGENILHLVQLTPLQIELLGHLTCWSVLQNADHFREMLSQGMDGQES